MIKPQDANLFKSLPQAAWVAQSVEPLTSAWVMISQYVSLSPTLGSVLTVWTQLRILCLSLSAPPPK